MATLLILLGVGLALSLTMPTWRRLWVFEIYALKYLCFGLGDMLGIRKIVAKLTGKTYAPYTPPVLLRMFCEDMGPTFLKFGQIVASSSGMFPKRYSDEFQKCLDRVRPFSSDIMKTILADELGPERLAGLIDIDEVPLASASIAQVHAARLIRPCGEEPIDVVIKVQRPGIETRIRADMTIMRFVAKLGAKLVKDAELANPVDIVEDFAHTLGEELDFRKERENLEEFNQIMSRLGHQGVRAPRPLADLCTQRVLVMERFFGNRVDDPEAIRANRPKAEDLLITGMRAWFQSVLFHGFFHGDVHAGNLMLLDNGDIGFLDFGIVGRFNGRQKKMVTDYIVAFVSADFRALAQTITEMGGVSSRVDLERFATDLGEAYGPLLKLNFAAIKYTELLPQIHRVASRHRMRMPKEFVLITKQLLYFDRYAKLIAPNLNVFTDPRLVGSFMADIARARAAQASA